MPNFDYTTRDLSTSSGVKATLVTLSGSVDPSTFDDFSAMFDALLAEDRVNVIIDFSKLKYINSTGMGLMVQVADGFMERDGRIVLMNIPQKVMLVMEMLGLQEFFQIAADENEALALFEGGQAESATVEVRIKDEEAEQEEPRPARPGGPVIKTAAKRPPKPAPAAGAAGAMEVACGHCRAQLTLSGEGKYRCPRCRSFLEVDEGGTVRTHPERSPSAVELTLPADADFVGALDSMLSTAAARAGVNGEEVAALSEAVGASGRYLIKHALEKGAGERLHVYLEGSDGIATARLYAAGQRLQLAGEDLATLLEIPQAGPRLKRLDFASSRSGNLFVIEVARS